MKKKRAGGYALLTLSGIQLIVDIALWGAIAVTVTLFALEFPHSGRIDSLTIVKDLRLWVDPLLNEAGAKVGWERATSGLSFLPLGGAFAVLVVKLIFDTFMLKLKRLSQKLFPLPDETLALSASASSKGISVSSTLLALASVSDKALAKVRRRYERVEQKLAATKRRHCAFISVGIVDAEEMKLGEDSEKISRSFQAYEEMLGGIFKATGAWKEAWTTDGVMVCYLDVNRAVEGGQRALQSLAEFNSARNELAHAFRVSCGVNEGDVIIFEDSKLHKVADRVIDIAGHMQKKGRPNCLWLSSEIHDRLENTAGFHPAGAEVDGFTVFEWSA